MWKQRISNFLDITCFYTTLLLTCIVVVFFYEVIYQLINLLLLSIFVK